MLTRRPLYLLYTLFIALQLVSAIPIVVKRQKLGESQTVTTVSEVTTFSGTVIETCTVTLTPILDDNGQTAFRVVRSCVLTTPSGNTSANPLASTSLAVDPNAPSETPASNAAPSPTPSTSSPVTERPALSNSVPSATASAPSEGPTDLPVTTASLASTSNVVPSNTDSPIASGTPSNSASSVNSSPPATATSSRPGLEIVSVPSIPTASISRSASASLTASSTSTTPSQGSISTSASPVDSSPAPSSPLNNVAEASAVAENSSSAAAVAAAAAAATATPAAAVVIPGQHVEVLPIGLGVFAGISAIALIIVGLVTYERTKYRKKFRAQKLAETGAPMGYGGMRQ